MFFKKEKVLNKYYVVMKTNNGYSEVTIYSNNPVDESLINECKQAAYSSSMRPDWVVVLTIIKLKKDGQRPIRTED